MPHFKVTRPIGGWFVCAGPPVLLWPLKRSNGLGLQGTDAELATSMFPDAATAWKMAFINQVTAAPLQHRNVAPYPIDRCDASRL